ncbi:glycosyltransferase family 4 protein [Salipiger sp. P9]|uniref:glycosyltransferase family 4 protein n=1 Tax=Salipiger pentaromativorans TaxID=2943193 RepID=UPI00215829C0|nr:glycosyltransferase family 4 protein [Salipiger pentaromativorans]MCR8550883.1 glycosyltransferase family 4 protein [Salipiger pentaromativorans]
MKIAALCDFPYWEANVGTAIRYESLCQSLSTVCDLTVISSVTLHGKYRPFANQAPYTLIDRKHLKDLDKTQGLADIPGVRPDRQMTVRSIKHYIESNGFDAVLTPYFNRKWMIEHLAPQIVRIIDTHDCQSQRTRSFAMHGLTPTFSMTPETEGAELDYYDLAIAMSDEDQAEFVKMTQIPIVTAPFRLPVRNIYRNKTSAQDLLFIAAKSDVNDMTLAYLLREVMPLVGRETNLHIVGNVTVPEFRPSNTNVINHDRIEDLADIYSQVDLALNPTYAGGGVKTKTLEAICYGVPILTSDEGARGMRHLIPDPLIANDKETFAYQIGALLGDYRQRMQLSKQIIQNVVAEPSEAWTEPFRHILAAVRAEKLGAAA